MTASAHTIPSGLAQIAVETAGKGTPVVFLHAGVADRRMWSDQLAALAQPGSGFRGVAYDRRGFGDTVHVDERYAQVDDLRAYWTRPRQVRGRSWSAARRAGASPSTWRWRIPIVSPHCC